VTGRLRARLRHAWIWFWYSDATRLLLVLLPGHFVVTLPLGYALGMREGLRDWAVFTYVAGFVWAMSDSDFTRLEEIGLDAHRRPLRRKEQP
jgi:RsiW-degrading membrane proteinase PrsW (M82 family)